ncbi:MAG: DUF1223 domain-containing protein [Oceanicaulis sp.]|nr:DUF1223 domain-containing protein [Oceanicaulis sp.]
MINALAPFLIALALSQSNGQPRPLADEAAPAPGAGLVVAELFTSQACRFCPAANEWLAVAGERDHVLALAYGVDYWDAMYDWPDEYAQPDFVERQKAYVDAGEARRVFTPHLVINGGPERMRFSPERAEAALDAAAFLSAPDARIEGEAIAIRLDGPQLDAPADVWVMHFSPGAERRLISAGSNAGVEMVHFNVVRAIAHAGEWPGGRATLHTPAPGGDQSSAVLVQAGPGGRLIAAARVRAGSGE